jgi:hypothetical protein
LQLTLRLDFLKRIALLFGFQQDLFQPDVISVIRAAVGSNLTLETSGSLVLVRDRPDDIPESLSTIVPTRKMLHGAPSCLLWW